MRPLSVAMIGQRGVPATFGGIERHVEEVGARLAERGHDVSVYCRVGYTETDQPTYRGMQLRRLPAVPTKHLEAISHSTLSLANALAKRHDVVHFHALGPGLLSPLVRLRPRTGVVQTVHGLDGERAKWGTTATRVLRLGERLSSRVPDETLVVSQALADHYRSVHGRKTTVTPNGVVPATPESADVLDPRWKLTPGRYVLFVGRLVPEKRPDLLLEAFRSLDTDARLVIAGGGSFTGDYVHELTRQAAQDKRVLMTGYVYGRQLAALYSHAAIFVLPSDLEGQPLTLLEAASYGRPVVTSDLPPLLEVIGQPRPGAAVFPRGDAAALRARLAGALSGDEAVRNGADALRSAVLRRHSWNSTTDVIEAAYRRALDRRRTHT